MNSVRGMVREGLIAGLCAGLLAAFPAQAQAPVERRPPQAPVSDERPLPSETPQSERGNEVETIRVRTRLVNLAVNVEDAHGAPIGGLTRDSFVVTEDGQPVKLAVFERESAAPLSLVLLIDASESVLRNERLEREAAKHFAKALLREQDEIDLMDFSDTVREIVPFTNSRRRFEDGLSEVRHGDETALYDAIYLASQRLRGTRQDPGRRRVVVLITDGTDTTRGGSYPQALEEAQRAGAMVYSLIIVPVASDAGRNTGGEHALIQMARDTGGKYFYVEDPRDLEPAFAHVSDDLRTQYVLGYYAPNGKAETAFRHVAVRLTDPALARTSSLRYRNGYYAEGAAR